MKMINEPGLEPKYVKIHPDEEFPKKPEKILVGDIWLLPTWLRGEKIHRIAVVSKVYFDGSKTMIQFGEDEWSEWALLQGYVDCIFLARP